MNMTIFWLIAFILFVVGEAVTVGLVSIWFAVGSLGALLTAALGGGLWLQIVIFLLLSALSLMLLKPLSRKWMAGHKAARTNADRVIGETALVTEDIDNIQGKGRVSISGADWTARAQEDRPIPAGSKVRVLRIEGVKVIVVPADTQEPSQP